MTISREQQLEQQVRELREALEDFVDTTATAVHGGIADPKISSQLSRLCKLHGYGNVIATASMIWRAIDGKGAFLFGPCEAVARQQLEKAEAALKAHP
jgi:hypothetical protein